MFVEPRRLPGQWTGGSRGVSLRIAKGVTYRVGASKRTYQQGAEVFQPTDQGTFVITDRRCLFVGSKRTTEWAFSKLVGFSLEGVGSAIFNVSNRQKASGVIYGAELENTVDVLIAAAVARFQSEEAHATLVKELEDEYRVTYSQLEAARASALPPGPWP